MQCTEVSLKDVIARHGGVLAAGAHGPLYSDPACPLCLLEAYAACLVERGELDAITDDPAKLGRPDYRPINDAAWSSREVATPHLVRLHIAYDGWRDFDDTRRCAIVERIAIETVRQIISELHGLSDDVRASCRAASTLEAARASASTALRAAEAAAEAAAAAARAAAAAAARAAARAAAASAAAAAAAAAKWATEEKESADAVLIRAVDIWVAAIEN